MTFAEIGLRLGAEPLAAQARAYGFCGTLPPEQTTCDEQLIPFVLPFQNGRFPEPAYFEQNEPLLAFSAIGLDNDLVNPLQMALIASAVANGGVHAAAADRLGGPRLAGTGGARVRECGTVRRAISGSTAAELAPDDDRAS